MNRLRDRTFLRHLASSGFSWLRSVRLDLLVAMTLTLFVVAGVSYGVYRLATGFFRVAPYQAALDAYSRGQFEEAIRVLRAAGKDGPLSVGDVTLLGWSYYRSGKHEMAMQAFRQAMILDPLDEYPKTGLAYASLANDLPLVALPILLELTQRHPEDAELQLALGEAHFKRGDNFAAAQLYRDLIRRGVGAEIAKTRFLAHYGYQTYSDDLPLVPTPAVRPASLMMNFRAHGDFFEVREGNEWRQTYLRGVNIGPARPGEFPSSPPLETETYLEWLNLIAQMNANVVRAYTILPPAFYQALKHHNDYATQKLWLLQEVLLSETGERRDLYDETWTAEFRQEIRDVIDVIHGQANIPYRRGRAGAGIYTADVSGNVLALGLGREVEPHLVLSTNAVNRPRTDYQGRFVSVADGSPTERWFAEIADLAVAYEMEKYNSQRPITLINWPPLDPMYHITESNYLDEIRIRRSRGEEIGDVITGPVNDADAVSLDIRQFRATADFRAGLFATYHVYPYWPDFMLYDPVYSRFLDGDGTNRYLGYLRDLKGHHPGMPLLIAEYGVPTSWGVAHIHPEGWSNGGFSEKAQAELLVRMTRNIRDSGAAGGIVFSWKDEWWKRVGDEFTRPFMTPADRKPLWLNPLNPEEFFGVLGYRSRPPVPLLRGKPEDWARVQHLIEARPTRKPQRGALKNLYAFSDPGFLYLRVDVSKGEGGGKVFGWRQTEYWIALNVLPGKAGSRTLPEIDVKLTAGATFLVRLAGPESGTIYISQNYNPLTWILRTGTPGGWRVQRRANMQIMLEDVSRFEELVIEANPPRYGRDGSVFPPLFWSRSTLPYGTADPESPQYSNLAAWHADEDTGLIELRIPWGLLYFLDPSSRLVLSGMDDQTQPVPGETPGVGIVAMAIGVLREDGKTQRRLLDLLPPPVGGQITARQTPIYTWEKWNSAEYEPYLKASYFALQGIFAQVGAKETIPRLKALLARDPSNTGVRIELARLLSWTGELSAAVREADTALRSIPGNREALLTKANAFRWQGNFNAAGPIFRDLLRAQEDFDARIGLTFSLLATGDMEGARESLALLRQLRPKYTYQEKDVRELIEALERVAR